MILLLRRGLPQARFAEGLFSPESAPASQAVHPFSTRALCRCHSDVSHPFGFAQGWLLRFLQGWEPRTHARFSVKDRNRDPYRPPFRKNRERACPERPEQTRGKPNGMGHPQWEWHPAGPLGGRPSAAEAAVPLLSVFSARLKSCPSHL
jgi:hypothetical protein